MMIQNNGNAHKRRMTSRFLKFSLSSFVEPFSPNLKHGCLIKFARPTSFVTENGCHHCAYATNFRFLTFCIAIGVQKTPFSSHLPQILCIRLKCDIVQPFNFFSKTEVDFPSCASLTSGITHIHYQQALNIAT